MSTLASLSKKEMDSNEISVFFYNTIEEFSTVLETIISIRNPAVTDKWWPEIKKVFRNHASKLNLSAKAKVHLP
jgi:hypothetical protein